MHDLIDLADRKKKIIYLPLRYTSFLRVRSQGTRPHFRQECIGLVPFFLLWIQHELKTFMRCNIPKTTRLDILQKTESKSERNQGNNMWTTYVFLNKANTSHVNRVFHYHI